MQITNDCSDLMDGWMDGCRIAFFATEMIKSTLNNFFEFFLKFFENNFIFENQIHYRHLLITIYMKKNHNEFNVQFVTEPLKLSL